MNQRTKPKQAASPSWLDRTQQRLEEALALIEEEGAGCEVCQGVKANLAGLLRSLKRAERR